MIFNNLGPRHARSKVRNQSLCLAPRNNRPNSTDKCATRTMGKSLRRVVTGLGAVVLMGACGLVAYVGALTFLMNLGLKLHDNYEYYGGFCGSIFIFGSGAIGFAAPGAILWHLRNRNVRFSIRTIFIVMTAVAVIVAIYALSL